MSHKLNRDLTLIRAAGILKFGHLPPHIDRQTLDHQLNPPAAKTKAFPYRPLDASNSEIRLLRISRPAEVDGLVNLTIEHVSLDSDPVYEALSYTWMDSTGDSKARERLLLNGVTVKVTRNLNFAIREVFLKRPGEVAFWVDALCIHQADIPELDYQVSRMSQIYLKAERVIAWLGAEDGKSSLAFKTLCEILAKGVKETVYAGRWEHHQGLEAHACAKALSLIDLFRRPWWGRMWIVQEAALAKVLVLHCGPDTIIWETLEAAVKMLLPERNLLLDSFVHKDIAPYVMILAIEETARYMFSFGTVDRTIRKAPLGTLLINNRYKLCLDARDKIYGLLGLTSTLMQNRINITYSKCTMRVYLDATIAVLEEEKDFNVVLENKRERAFDRTAKFNYGLPTWVCNYHNVHGNENLGLISQFSYAWTGAAGETPLVVNVNRRSGPGLPSCLHTEGMHECRCEIGSTSEDDTLQVRGIAIGRITAVGSLMPEDITFEHHFPPVINTLYEWWLMYLSVGGKSILGDKNSFVNIIKCGDYYRELWNPNNHLTRYASSEKIWEHLMSTLTKNDFAIRQREKELMEHEDRIRRCLNIVMGIHKPKDIELRRRLGKPVTASGPKEIQQAEGNIWLATMTTTNRRFMTVGAYCGLAPMCAEAGDIVVVVLGSKVPIVLRERAPSIGGGYLNIGDAYLHGFMDGEVIDLLEDGSKTTEDFVIH